MKIKISLLAIAVLFDIAFIFFFKTESVAAQTLSYITLIMALIWPYSREYVEVEWRAVYHILIGYWIGSICIYLISWVLYGGSFDLWVLRMNNRMLHIPIYLTSFVLSIIYVYKYVRE